MTEDAEAVDPRHEEANKVVRHHAAFGAVAGLIPVPAIDVLAITGIQIRMIAELSRVYEIPFSENVVKSYVIALIGGVVPVSGVSGYLMSLSKSVPGVGTLLGIAVVPGVAAAITWAIGRVFVWHFERGGTLADFDPEAMKDRFKKEYEGAKSALSRAKSKITGGKGEQGSTA